MSYRQPFQGEWPITQRYGEIVPGVTVNGKPHSGIDYACPAATPILASSDGVVMFAGWDSTGFGWCVILRHSEQCSTLYAHLSLIPRRILAGITVKQGEEIGLSGSTGNSTGPHLHFEARKVWNDYKSHFDPMTLPLMNFADFAGENPVNSEETSQILGNTSQKLKEPEDLPELVQVVCRDGARVFNQDWSMRDVSFPQGTELHFTGKCVKRPGFPELTYCEVYEEPRKYYVAVHDGETQILDSE